MIDHHALAAGFSHRFLVAAGIILLAFIIAVAAVPGCRADLAGSTTQRQPSRTDDTRLPAIGP